MKKNSLTSIILILTLSLFGCKEEKKRNKIITEFTIETADYEIAKIEDLSRKAFGKKLLSQYTISEIEQLPTNKKNSYKIILSKDIKENQVKPTIEKIVYELTSKDSDIDEIILCFYSSKEVLNNPYDIGTAIWAPNGELGNINADIAQNNNRENYNIKYNIKENLEQYLEQISKSEVKFGFTENERKQIFKDIVNAEDKAHEYERIEQDKILDSLLENNGKFDDKTREYMKKEYSKISEKSEKIKKNGKSKVFKKYKITGELEMKIKTEGLIENWPFE